MATVADLPLMSINLRLIDPGGLAKSILNKGDSEPSVYVYSHS